jgi:hypothetical protein
MGDSIFFTAVQCSGAVSPMMHKSNISNCQKNFFSFPVALNSSIKEGPLVFCFNVITENIMKRPVVPIDIHVY